MATYTFENLVFDGDLSNGANYDLNAVPGPGDDLVIAMDCDNVTNGLLEVSTIEVDANVTLNGGTLIADLAWTVGNGYVLGSGTFGGAEMVLANNPMSAGNPSTFNCPVLIDIGTANIMNANGYTAVFNGQTNFQDGCLVTGTLYTFNGPVDAGSGSEFQSNPTFNSSFTGADTTWADIATFNGDVNYSISSGVYTWIFGVGGTVRFSGGGLILMAAAVIGGDVHFGTGGYPDNGCIISGNIFLDTCQAYGSGTSLEGRPVFLNGDCTLFGTANVGGINLSGTTLNVQTGTTVVIGDDITLDGSTLFSVNPGATGYSFSGGITGETPLSGGTVPSAFDVRYGVAVGSGTGTAYIPSAADVRHGTNVDATTGTAFIPTAANVLFGVNTDNTTGTYHSAAAGDVRSGTAIGTATGTLAVPTAANVLFGVSVDNTTGTYHGTTAANVRSGTAIGTTTGTLAVPSAANVLNGVAVDNTTGDYVVATTRNVRSGTTFGAASAQTGTLAVPAVGNVLNGVAVDDTTGNYVTVIASNVRNGAAFGPAGDLDGTLLVPSAANVLFGVGVDNTTGTYVGASAADVRAGTNIGQTVGTLAVPSAANVLHGVNVDNTTGTYYTTAATDVRHGTTFGPAQGLTGSSFIPTASNVRSGTNVDATTGTLVVPTVGQVEAGIVFDNGSIGTYTGGFVPPTNEQTGAYLYTDTGGVVISYQMVVPPAGSGMEFDGTVHLVASSTESGSYGLWQAAMYKGATYKIQSGNGPALTVVIPVDAGNTTELANLLRG